MEMQDIEAFEDGFREAEEVTVDGVVEGLAVGASGAVGGRFQS